MQINVVDVDDVALGHRLAMEKGRPGERYILGNHNTDLAQVLRTVAALAGVPPPKMAIPYSVGVVFSFFAELVMTRILRRPTLFTLAGARMVRRRMHASNEKAVRELGLTLTPFEEVLRKAIRWFHGHGYIRKPIRIP
jgi:dihydroflavonol-4-reductase